MSRYIDADRFKDTLEGASEKMHLICGVKAVEIGAVIKAVDMFPIADVVEVRHGEWIDDDTWSADMLHYRCSICGNYVGCKTNFCSNCGAKMDGERSEK